MYQSVQKLTVLVLLSMAAVDLAWPGFCPSEQLDLSAIPSQQTHVFQSNNEQQPPAPVGSPEDDCFCCCSHVFPRPVIFIQAFYLTVDHSQQETDTPILLFPQTIYHPPRSI